MGPEGILSVYRQGICLASLNTIHKAKGLHRWTKKNISSKRYIACYSVDRHTHTHTHTPTHITHSEAHTDTTSHSQWAQLEDFLHSNVQLLHRPLFPHTSMGHHYPWHALSHLHCSLKKARIMNSILAKQSHDQESINPITVTQIILSPQSSATLMVQMRWQDL